jgi:hypothetical protein
LQKRVHWLTTVCSLRQAEVELLQRIAMWLRKLDQVRGGL